MTSPAERLAARAVLANNARVRRATGHLPSVVEGPNVPWHGALAAAAPDMAAEWTEFEAAGGRLPLIEQLLAESQGNEGPWRVGLLVSRGRPVGPLPALFPATMGALAGVPGLRSALWSLLEPGTELPAHEGPNAGVLRYHLGVRCPAGVGLQVGDVTVELTDGVGVLFDDTVTHASWNRGPTSRLTLFCEVLRPLPGPAALANRAVQALLSLDHRYRDAPGRAAEWHHALAVPGGRIRDGLR